MVVPVRDDADGLARLIVALGGQSLPPGKFELIVGDDGSQDGAALARLGAAHDWITMSAGPPLNSYVARNRAARVAVGEFLAFTDADCIPAAHWLEAGCSLLSSHELLAGRVTPLLPERPTSWSLLDMRGWHDMEHFLRAGSGVTANLFMRRELFDRLGGFDATLASNADDEFVARAIALGAGAAFTADAWVGHPTIDRAGPYLRKQWFRQHWVGVRSARAGLRPERARLAGLLPLASWVRRRRQGLPLALDRQRCAEEGVRVGRLARTGCALLLHGPLAYWCAAAQWHGWRGERRAMRRARAGVG